MRFLCGVVGIVVAHLPLLMARLSQAAPSPEITARKQATLLSMVSHQREDVPIIAVASLCRCVECELEAIARITELLHHQGFVQAFADGQMLVDILLGVLTGTRQMLDERVRMRPSPVVRPQMYITVVDVAVGTDALVALNIILTAP